AHVEGEGVEHAAGAQPHVAAGADVGVGAERVGVLRAHRGVHAVRGDHQVVRGGELVDVGRLGPEQQLDPEVGAALLQQLQQPAAAHRGEAVTAGGDDLAAVVHVDVVPAGELGLHPGEDHGVGV